MKILNDLNDMRATLAPIYSRYRTEVNPQPAYIEIDMEKETVEADYSGEIGNAVPAKVWHGLVRRIPVTPYAKGSVLAAFLESDELRTLVERMIAGFESVWNGNNYVSKMTPDASAAEEELERAAEAFFDPADHVQVYTVDAWMKSSVYTNEDTGNVAIEFVGTVTADSSDAELESMATIIRTLAAKEDIYLESSAIDWITELRDGCIRARNAA